MKQAWPSKPNQQFSNTVARALQMLEAFSPEKPNRSFPELHRITGVPRSTVFRLLKTLTELNYLRYHSETRNYSLGPRVLSLGFSVLQSMEIREFTRPYLEKLSRQCNKSVNLLMLDRQQMVFIERVRVPGLRDFNISVGSTIPIYNTAAGRAVLAYMDEGKFREIVQRLKKEPEALRYIGRNANTLDQLLTEVRRNGFAINDEESTKGVRAIAVPIFSPEGVTYAMDMIVAPEEVSVEELKDQYAPRLITAGKEISKAMGWDQDGTKD